MKWTVVPVRAFDDSVRYEVHCGDQALCIVGPDRKFAALHFINLLEADWVAQRLNKSDVR